MKIHFTALVRETAVLIKDIGFLVLLALWAFQIWTIAFYGSYMGWYVWTWLPILGYIGGSIGLAYFFNKARKALQNTSMGVGYDDKKWLTAEERAAVIDKVFLKRG